LVVIPVIRFSALVLILAARHLAVANNKAISNWCSGVTVLARSAMDIPAAPTRCRRYLGARKRPVVDAVGALG
jgi:hypothetical protein